MVENASLDVQGTLALLRDAAFALQTGNVCLAEERARRAVEALMTSKFKIASPDKLVVVAQVWRWEETKFQPKVSG